MAAPIINKARNTAVTGTSSLMVGIVPKNAISGVNGPRRTCFWPIFGCGVALLGESAGSAVGSMVENKVEDNNDSDVLDGVSAAADIAAADISAAPPRVAVAVADMTVEVAGVSVDSVEGVAEEIASDCVAGTEAVTVIIMSFVVSAVMVTTSGPVSAVTVTSRGTVSAAVTVTT